MSRLVFLLFILFSTFSYGQIDSTVLAKTFTIKDAIEQEIITMDQLENFSSKRLEIKGETYVVYHKNDTIYKIVMDKYLRLNLDAPNNVKSLIELYLSNGVLKYGVLRCETPLNFSRPHQLEINYYEFKNGKTANIYKEGCCECMVTDKRYVSKMLKSIKKIKRRIARMM